MIILSAMKDTIIKVTGFNQGADDYLTKPFDMDELIARINARLRHNDDHTILTYDDLTLDTERRKARRRNRTIMGHVWDYCTGMSKNVVEVRICYLRKKLTEGGERNLIATIRGLGYALK